MLVEAILRHEPHEFPEAVTSRTLPVAVRDETLEFYAFVFCQGGFRHLGMTFEQFLLVAAAINQPTCRRPARTLVLLEQVTFYGLISIAEVMTCRPWFETTRRIALVILDFGPIALIHTFVTQ